MNLDLLLFAVILSVAHFLGQRLDLRGSRLMGVVRSLSAGVSIAYTFIILLPELTNINDSELDAVLLMPLLLGVTFFHVTLRSLAKVTSRKTEAIWNERVHLLMLTLANLVSSYVAMELLKQDFQAGVILIVILFFHYLLLDIVVIKMRKRNSIEKPLWELLLVLSPILVGILSLTNSLNLVYREFIFAFAIGTVFYMTLHEEIPEEKEGRPVFFALGVLVIVLFLYTSGAL